MNTIPFMTLTAKDCINMNTQQETVHTGKSAPDADMPTGCNLDINNWSASDLDRLVDCIVARIRQREQAICVMSVEELEQHFSDAICLHAATLDIRLQDLTLLHRITSHQDDHPTLQHLARALALGMHLYLSIPAPLLPLLVTDRQMLQVLARLPFRLQTLTGEQVSVYDGQLLSQRDVFGLPGGWLLLASRTCITPLARETLVQRHLQLIRTE